MSPNLITKKNIALIIDMNYLADLEKQVDDQWQRKIDSDLANITRIDVVELRAPRNPRLMSLYTDVRAYIAAKSIQGGYSIRVKSTYDGKMIKQVLGKAAVEVHKNEYRFMPA